MLGKTVSHTSRSSNNPSLAAVSPSRLYKIVTNPSVLIVRCRSLPGSAQKGMDAGSLKKNLGATP